jgi:DNA-binding transcriptional regulator YiaG
LQGVILKRYVRNTTTNQKSNRMKKLKDYLTKHELSDSEFARLHGFTQQSVWDWKSGRTKPNGENMVKLLKIIGDE